MRVSGDLGFRLFDWGSKNPDPETDGPTQGPSLAPLFWASL